MAWLIDKLFFEGHSTPCKQPLLFEFYIIVLWHIIKGSYNENWYNQEKFNLKVLALFLKIKKNLNGIYLTIISILYDFFIELLETFLKVKRSDSPKNY